MLNFKDLYHHDFFDKKKNYTRQKFYEYTKRFTKNKKKKKKKKDTFRRRYIKQNTYFTLAQFQISSVISRMQESYEEKLYSHVAMILRL